MRMHPILQRLAVAALLAATSCASADTIVIRNVRIFNGVDAELTAGHVLVADGLIRRISAEPIDAGAGATVIDGADRVMTPGFIDLHVHLTSHYPVSQNHFHPTVAGAYAGAVARFYLMSGFTTIRDGGGTHPDLALAFESGELPGPRVYPSGAILSQTAGHGDSRARHEPHPFLESSRNPYQPTFESVLVDGVPQTLAAVRENLRLGATQIKIMGGGGVMSDFDPIHSLQPSPDEIRAAVQAASDWNTYVMAHAYTSEAVRRLVENGVRCIEHGLLIDEDTARLVAKNNVVISTQLMTFRTLQQLPGITPTQVEKLKLVLAGQENLIRLIKKYKITTGFSTDFVYGAYRLLGKEFIARAEYWTPAEVLRQATSESAGIIRMAGKLNRHGNFGEIREGWVADLLLINGEPLEDISILEHPDKSLALIMQRGRIVKQAL